MEGVRRYGNLLAVVTVTDRRAAVDSGGTAWQLDVGEEIGRRAVVNRVVAELPVEVGLVAVTRDGHVWAPGALDALRRAAARHPRAGVLGPGVGAGTVGFEDSGVLIRRAAWDSVDGWDTRVRDPGRAAADLGLRLVRAGWLLVPVPEARVVPVPEARVFTVPEARVVPVPEARVVPVPEAEAEADPIDAQGMLGA